MVPVLTVVDVDAAFTEIGATAGKGSQARRAALVADLFGAATEAEQTFLRRLLGGELRQGALAGVMADAVARAAGIAAPTVRRAAMLRGDLPAIAAAALTRGADALADFTLQVGQPVGPMLAQTANGVVDALEKLRGTAIFEAKLDGARVQIHRSGSDVTVYTRSLDDVTARLPEVVEATLALPVHDLIADGEAIALRPDGRPERPRSPSSSPSERPTRPPSSACAPLTSSPSCNQARSSIPSSPSPAVDTPRWAAACRSPARARSSPASESAAERPSRTSPSSKRR